MLTVSARCARHSCVPWLIANIAHRFDSLRSPKLRNIAHRKHCSPFRLAALAEIARHSSSQTLITVSVGDAPCFGSVRARHALMCTSLAVTLAARRPAPICLPQCRAVRVSLYTRPLRNACYEHVGWLNARQRGIRCVHTNQTCHQHMQHHKRAAERLDIRRRDTR